MNKLFSTLMLLLVVILLFFTVAGNHGLLHLYQINTELQSLEQKNYELESEIIDLQNKIFALQNNDLVLEKNAREQVGLSKPGEIVYIFPETKE